MVEVQMKQQFSYVIIFCNEHRNLVEQKIEFEWKRIVCKKCTGVEHHEEECRKGAGKKMWIPKQKMVVDQDGFQQVGNNKTMQQTLENEVPMHNPFDALLEAAQENSKEDEMLGTAKEEADSNLDKASGAKQSNEARHVKGQVLETPIHS